MGFFIKFIMMYCLGLVEIYDEYMASHTYVVGRGRSILIAFANNFVYYSLILHQNSVGSFLKIGCNAESETISINISPSVILKIDWFILSLTPEWIFYSCMIF